MPAYPNTNFSNGSTVTPRENIAIDVSADGTIRGRKLRAAETYDLTLMHRILLQSDADTIENFYEANTTAVITVTWRSVQYDCYWVAKPTVDNVDADLWTVTSKLVGKRSDGL